MSKSTNGLRKAGLASIAVALTLGAGVVGAGSAAAVPGFDFGRIAGDDRYDTSALAAEEFSATSTDAILANGEPGNYADALTANYLSGVKNAPILLTRENRLPDEVRAQLEDSGVETIWVVGGDGVVSNELVAELEADGYTVNRVAGSNRFDTNAEVIEAGGNAPENTFLVTTGFNFPDALAAGPLGYQGHPIALSTEDQVDADVVAALEAAGVTSFIIVGGEAAVSDAVRAQLVAEGFEFVERLAGPGRDETSVEVAEFATANLGFKVSEGNVASGYIEGYGADALAGGPLTGKLERPMLITQSDTNPGSLIGYLEENCEVFADGDIFGGPVAVSLAAEEAMNEAARCDTAPGTNPFGANSSTGAPELQDITISGTDATVVTYRFDESIPGQALDFFGTAPFRTYEDFRLYVDLPGEEGHQAIFPREARVEGDSVIARFASADQVKAAVRGTVRYGAVEDASGIANVEGEIPLAPTVITTSVAPFEPQLVDVRNFRLSDVIVGGTQEVLVDYVFSSYPGVLTDADAFHLVGSNSQDYAGTAIIPGPVPAPADQDEPYTVTVQLADDLRTVPESQLRRGYVEFPDNEVVDGVSDFVILSDAYENGTGQTVDPDLVSAQVTNETAANYTVRYVFDEAISDDGLDADEFYLYDSDGDTITATQVARSALTADAATVVIATFDASDFQPVGAFIEDAAVTATDNTASANDGNNRPDERDLTLPAPTVTTIPAGFTTLPDLLAVDVEQNVVTENYSVSYVFDEPRAEVESGMAQIAFDLYDASGTQFRVVGVTDDTAGVAVTSNTGDTQTTVTFSIDEGFALFDNEQIAAAVTGAVEDIDSVPADGDDEDTAVDYVVQPVVTEGQQDVS